MNETKIYKLLGSDSDEPIIFTKKGLKLFDGLPMKFANSTEVRLNYSYKCLRMIKDYCDFYNSLSKKKKMQFCKIGMISGKMEKMYNEYLWCMEWIQDYSMIEELSNFVSMFKSENVVDIIGMHIAKLIKNNSPTEIIKILGVEQDYTESDLKSIIQSSEWVEDMF